MIKTEHEVKNRDMQIDRVKNSKRNIAWGFLGRIITVLLPFILRTVMISTIGEEYLGLSSLFNSMLSMLSLAELGLGSAMVYYMYKPLAEERHEEICALLRLYRDLYRIIGAIILGIGLILIPFLDYFIKGSYPEGINLVVLYLIYLFDTVLSYGLFSYRQSLLIVHQRNDVIFKIQLLVNSGLYLFQILFLVIFKNYYLFIILKPIFTLMNNILILCTSRRLYPEYECVGNVPTEKIKEISKKVKALAGHKIGTTVISSADSIVISAFLGLTMVARYGNYYTIIAAVISVMGMLVNSILAGVGNGLVVGKPDENYTLFSNLNYLIMWIVGWCAICFMCLFQPFMEIWVGSNMLLPISSVLLFALYYYSWQCRVCVLLFKDAAGQWDADFWKPYVSAIVNLVTNVLLVKTIGFNGVLISTIITMIFINIPWETHVLFKNVFKKDENKYYLEQIRFLLKTIIVGSVTYYLCNIVPIAGIAGLLIKGGVCVVVPNVAFLIIALKRPEFAFIKRIINTHRK